MRRGLATVQTQPHAFWDDIAARMMDAQAPGLARRLRECASIPYSGEGWPERLLAALGKLYLLVRGYQRLETLSPGLQAELRTQVGWTQKKQDVLALPELSPIAHDGRVMNSVDQWQVLGIRVLEDDRLWTQRVWLWGKNRDRPALILDFSYGNPTFDAQDPNLVPGITLPAELVFYPSSYPLRALIKQLTGTVEPSFALTNGRTVAEAIALYGTALAQNPWLDLMPLILNGVVPRHDDTGWYVADYPADDFSDTHADTHWPCLPVHPNFPHCWELLALSGGHPVAIAGEWNGTHLWPLSVSVEHRLIVF